MTEKQIQIIVARTDLVLSTVGRVVIVMIALFMLTVVTVMLWRTICAIHHHDLTDCMDSNNSTHRVHSTHSARHPL